VLLMYAHHPLQVKCHAHFHKHISAIRGFIVDTECSGLIIPDTILGGTVATMT
jgi:hypothetical protein